MPVLKIKQNGEWVDIAGGSDNDSLTVELEGANIGTPNAINADTLNGKTEDMLSVANAEKLGGHTAEDFIRPKAGFIYPLAGSVIPEGFLLCDGAEYGRTEFPELFAAIGTIYGNGNGSTTFNVPNLQTRVPVGAGESYELGAVGGETTHTLTVNEMPSHSHDTFAPEKTGSDWNYFISATASAVDTSNFIRVGTTNATGGSQPHNNMQPYTVVNYIIATGKDTGVSVSDIIMGAQAIPLEVQYGGTGATNAADARQNLGINEEIVDRVIYGKGKNLLKNTAKNQTSNGVTFTVNDDGSVTVNGTATDDVDFWLTNERYGSTNAIIPPGEYTISGATGAVYLIFGHGTNSKHTMNENTLTRVLDDGIAWCSLRVNKGDTVNNYVAYPMIRLASETDDTYEPYYKGLAELTDRGIELLWKNASPASDFTDQTITLSEECDMVLVNYYGVGNATANMAAIVTKDGGSTSLSCAQIDGNKSYLASRAASLSGKNIIFGAGYFVQAGSGTTTASYDVCKPTRIYGIKGVSA